MGQHWTSSCKAARFGTGKPALGIRCSTYNAVMLSDNFVSTKELASPASSRARRISPRSPIAVRSADRRSGFLPAGVDHRQRPISTVCSRLAAVIGATRQPLLSSWTGLSAGGRQAARREGAGGLAGRSRPIIREAPGLAEGRRAPCHFAPGLRAGDRNVVAAARTVARSRRSSAQHAPWSVAAGRRLGETIMPGVDCCNVRRGGAAPRNWRTRSPPAADIRQALPS